MDLYVLNFFFGTVTFMLFGVFENALFSIFFVVSFVVVILKVFNCIYNIFTGKKKNRYPLDTCSLSKSSENHSAVSSPLGIVFKNFFVEIFEFEISSSLFIQNDDSVRMQLKS